jgi:hypothetical protein
LLTCVAADKPIAAELGRYADKHNLGHYLMMPSLSAWAPHDELRQQAIDTAVCYLPLSSRRGQSAELRKSNQAAIMKLRDSLIYRSEAIIWHVTLQSRMQEQALATLRSTFPDPNAPRDIMRATAREQQFVFDDVVFNCIALFDYVANIVGFAYYGDRRRKAKWDRIQKYARDEEFDRRAHTNVRIAGSAVGALIRESQDALVSPLSDYRADLIHYETVPAGGRVTTRLENTSSGKLDLSFELKITVPKPFARRFVVPGYEADPAKATLVRAAEWVTTESHGRCKRILRELERDLRREAGRDPDGTDRVIDLA